MYCKHAGTIRSSLLPPLFFDPWSPAARQYYAEKLEGSLWKNIKIEFSEAGRPVRCLPGVQLVHQS